MKIIFRNSKLVFEKSYILQEFTKTHSKYLNLEGVESEADYSTNYVTNELPKSFIVYDDGDGLRVYVSQISTTTLLKRSDFLNKSSEISDF